LYNTNGDDTNEGRELRMSILLSDEFKALEYENLLKVLWLVFLRLGCWHISLEKSCANYNINESIPCQNNCPYCNKEIDSYIMPVRKVGLIAFLIDTFIRRMDSGAIDVNKLVIYLQKYKNVGTKVFTRRVNTAYKTRYLAVVVLQLIASRILIVTVIEDDEGKKRNVLHMNVMDDMGTLACSNEEYWNGINYV
jgi:hypothetical protein